MDFLLVVKTEEGNLPFKFPDENSRDKAFNEFSKLGFEVIKNIED